MKLYDFPNSSGMATHIYLLKICVLRLVVNDVIQTVTIRKGEKFITTVVGLLHYPPKLLPMIVICLRRVIKAFFVPFVAVTVMLKVCRTNNTFNSKPRKIDELHKLEIH